MSPDMRFTCLGCYKLIEDGTTYRVIDGKWHYHPRCVPSTTEAGGDAK